MLIKRKQDEDSFMWPDQRHTWYCGNFRPKIHLCGSGAGRLEDVGYETIAYEERRQAACSWMLLKRSGRRRGLTKARMPDVL